MKNDDSSSGGGDEAEQAFQVAKRESGEETPKRKAVLLLKSFFSIPPEEMNIPSPTAEEEPKLTLPNHVTKPITLRPVSMSTVSDISEEGLTAEDPSETELSASSWDRVPMRRRNRNPSPNTVARRLSRKYKKPSATWYHTVAAKNRLGSIHENVFLEDDSTAEEECSDSEEERQEAANVNVQQSSDTPNQHRHLSPLKRAKQDLLQALNQTKGDCNTPAFQNALQRLVDFYDSSRLDTSQRPTSRRISRDGRQKRQQIELGGIGISAGKPNFPGCIGQNDAGDPLYKLGVMSFDMFCPTQLVVSIQGTFVLIDTVDGRNPDAVKHIPKDLLGEVRFGNNQVRTYNVVTAFTIEPWKSEFGEDSPNKCVSGPIQGVMTTVGYILPYPTQSHRFSVWFTGGSLEVVDENDDKNKKWFQIFDRSNQEESSNNEEEPKRQQYLKRTVVESSKLLAAKVLMGATSNERLDENGKLSYTLTRPRANHIDLIYLDNKLQILRGSSGTVYVHVRIPGHKTVDSSVEPTAMLPSEIFNTESFVLSSEQSASVRDEDAESPEEEDDDLHPEAVQKRITKLIQEHKFKQAAELLHRAHSSSNSLHSMNQRAQPDSSLSFQTQQHRDPLRRSVSENNLRPHPGYAREA